MLFGRLFSTALLAFGLVSALPTPVVPGSYISRRSGKPVDLVTVLTKLKYETSVIVQQMNAVVASGTVNEATVTPVLDDLERVFTAATTVLNRGRPSANVKPRALSIAATIFDDLGLIVGPLTTAPALRPSLLAILNANHEITDNWIFATDVILPGFKALVAPLLDSMHQLTLAALGLI